MRFRGEVSEDVESWRWITLVFLQKIYNPATLKDFRGISLTSAVSKWYMCAVTLLAQKQSVPASWCDFGIFAYKEELSCMDLLLPLHFVLEAGFEWRRDQHVCVASGDILNAFDSLSVEHGCRDMITSGLHPQLVAAIAQENSCLEVQPHFPDCPNAASQPFNRCLRQGGVESPFCLNRTTAQVLSELVPGWKARRLGVLLDDGFCATHAVWADNYYLLSSSSESLQTMVRELSDGLVKRGLSWKPGSLQVMFSDELRSHDQISAYDENGVHIFEEVDSMEALGVLMCREGPSPRSVIHRLAKATRAFLANTDILLNKSLSLPMRFTEYTSRVQSVALYGAECWPMCQNTLQRLVAWESGLLRKMVGVQKQAGESWVSFHKRSARTSRSLYVRYGARRAT